MTTTHTTPTSATVDTVPAVSAGDFHLVRPDAVVRARAMLETGRWSHDDVVAAVVAALLGGAGAR